MLKFSRQRECIRANLIGRSDHPTAEMVYQDVKEALPNISLGTVYRNLMLLAERGEILKLSMPDGPDRFDGNVQPHAHFLCKECGGFQDVTIKNASTVFYDILPGFDGEITCGAIQLFGTCGLCRGKAESSSH